MLKGSASLFQCTIADPVHSRICKSCQMDATKSLSKYCDCLHQNIALPDCRIEQSTSEAQAPVLLSLTVPRCTLSDLCA